MVSRIETKVGIRDNSLSHAARANRSIECNPFISAKKLEF